MRGNALETLAYGALDHEKYRYTTGYIKALDDILALAGEIELELQGE